MFEKGRAQDLGHVRPQNDRVRERIGAVKQGIIAAGAIARWGVNKAAGLVQLVEQSLHLGTERRRTGAHPHQFLCTTLPQLGGGAFRDAEVFRVQCGEFAEESGAERRGLVAPAEDSMCLFDGRRNAGPAGIAERLVEPRGPKRGLQLMDVRKRCATGRKQDMQGVESIVRFLGRGGCVAFRSQSRQSPCLRVEVGDNAARCVGQQMVGGRGSPRRGSSGGG